jgi:hypothetical protein
MTSASSIRYLVIALAGLVGCVVFGTLTHELLGHGLVGLLCGGTIEYVDLLGVRFGAGIVWVGADGVFGRCGVQGIQSQSCDQLMRLAGSMSTWLISVLALLFFTRARSAVGRWMLFFPALWWFDLLTYTLPSFGLRRFALFGRTHREPYDAAVALGIPGPAFQAFVLAACTVQAALLLTLLHRISRRTQLLPTSPAAPTIR